ncbi:periplasmic divalent cation tolerance protein [Sphingomonas zeicaulis]|uniref:divalent-cation tolerance protein CutA n=1 Tax=Sphingomonas zeicaulis TaxID=1632740 RepID=UPI003D1DA0E5
MSALACVYALFADADEADRIGQQVVEEGLAGCVNIQAPCRSIYRWHGAIERATEVPALFKTRSALAEPLARRIAELHSYDVPAISHWPAETGTAYAAWLDEVTT